jgi:hypothetical protein
MVRTARFLLSHQAEAPARALSRHSLAFRVRVAARLCRAVLVMAFLGLLAAEGVAQTETGPAAASQADPLPGLPHPPDQPRSLLLPPPLPGPTPPPSPGPYFTADPLLDPPSLPAPGWFAAADIVLTAPYVTNKLTATVQIGDRAPDTVQLPSPHLDWTVSPRVEVGYRLPSGFGGFAFAYRFLASDATGAFSGLDGPASVTSRLDVQVFDFDYISHEISLWPHWDMTWWFGGRLANVYFDSQAEEPLAEALAGSNIFARRTTDRYIGFGPHSGLGLQRRLDEWGLAVVGRLDGWIGLGDIRQGFFEESTLLGPDGLPLSGQTHIRSMQAVPLLTTQVGLSWQPPAFCLPRLPVRALVERGPAEPHCVQGRAGGPGRRAAGAHQLLSAARDANPRLFVRQSAWPLRSHVAARSCQAPFQHTHLTIPVT